jgi:dTDP-4-amino-4,6-dideoxygalactose transaminase
MTAARRPVESPEPGGPAAAEPAVPPFAVRFSEAVIREFTAACEQVARSGTLTLGPRTARFEALVAGLAGTADAVAVTSGTTALELAFEGLGLKNDLVLIPANTSPATAAAAVRAGHRVGFYDAGAWATAAQVEAALDRYRQAGAVVVVHIGGFVSPEMPAIARLCRSRGVLLVEDAAHALGAGHGGRPAGSFGDAAAFSFFPTKVVTTAEGGVVTTTHPEAADAVRRLRNQGQLHGSATLIGGSYRLSEFSAALGEAQLNHRDEWLKGQAAVFDRYRAALDGAWFATVLGVPDGGRASGYKFIAMAATPQAREELRAHLARRGVSLAGGVYESLLHDDPRFRPHAAPGQGLFPAARDFVARHFCLPAWPGLTLQEQERVTAALDSFRASP